MIDTLKQWMKYRCFTIYLLLMKKTLAGRIEKLTGQRSETRHTSHF